MSAKGLRYNLLFVMFVLFVSYLLLPNCQLYGSGLDPSWVRYLVYGMDNKLLYGKDIVFTYGIFNQLGTNFYVSSLWEWLSLLFVVTIIFVIVVTDILGMKKSCSLFAIFFITQSPDSTFFFMIFIMTYWILLKNHNSFILGLITFSISIIMLIKFTFTVCSLLIIIALFYKRKWHAIIFLAGCFFIEWYVMQGRYSNIVQYFVHSYYIADGYNWSMQNLTLSSYDLRNHDAWLAMLQLSIFYVFIVYLTRMKDCFLSISLFIVLFFAYKESIVRADLHLRCLHQLSLLLVMFILSNEEIRKRRNYILVWGFCGALLILPIYYLYQVHSLQIPSPDLKKNYFEYYKINQQVPHKSLSNKSNICVDLYPADISKLLESDNRLCVRPVFQSYSAYNEHLLKLNLEHLKSSKAPDKIFWRIGPIDNRYPAQDDSISWPYILAYYSIIDEMGEYLILTKNSKHYTYNLNAIESLHNKKLGEAISLPSNGKIIWAEIDLKPSFIEKIIAILYKPNQLNLETHYSDGSYKSYKLIPAIAHAGFLLSPTIENNEEFSCISRKLNGASDCGKRVLYFVISTPNKRAEMLYKIDNIRFSNLDFSLGTENIR